MTLTEVKAALIAAHRAKDWEKAKKLSQLKQKLKKRRYCKICGVRINSARILNDGNILAPKHCQMHAILVRDHGSNSLDFNGVK